MAHYHSIFRIYICFFFSNKIKNIPTKILCDSFCKKAVFVKYRVTSFILFHSQKSKKKKEKLISSDSEIGKIVGVRLKCIKRTWRVNSSLENWKIFKSMWIFTQFMSLTKTNLEIISIFYIWQQVTDLEYNFSLKEKFFRFQKNEKQR